jgi:hypothetical protein
VYKAKLKKNSNSIDVALKELRLKDDQNAIYEFQHEFTIMRYSLPPNICVLIRNSQFNHENLVKLYGITVSPLQMVLEFVPNSDLHSVLKASKDLSMKWKLKVAIDTAAGMKYGSHSSFTCFPLLFLLSVLNSHCRIPKQIYLNCLLRYLHSQRPPICHSDLRAPNIFVRSQ